MHCVLTLRGTSGVFQPNPSPSQEWKEQGCCKRQCAGTGETPPGRAREDSRARCRSTPLPPAPQPDSCRHACPPKSPPLAQKPRKECERKNKKDMVPDAHRSEQGPGGIYLRYSMKHTTSPAGAVVTVIRGSLDNHLQFYYMTREMTRHSNSQTEGYGSPRPRGRRQPCVPPPGLGDRGPWQGWPVPS